ncbi:hypothetical protein I4U23_004380 [Adineta vaga]|nr:hypothetical protein I4U23_004380 [Adineta vaga]
MASDSCELKRFTNEQTLIEMDENWTICRENKESITLLWFDRNIKLNLPDIQLTKNRLREINDYVLFFTELDECLQFIKSTKSEKIFLIVSGNDAHILLSEIHNLRQIDSIFVFCVNKLKYEKLLVENSVYDKIVDIFTEQHSLIRSLQKNIQLAEQQMDIFNVCNQSQRSIRNLLKESGSFIWHQLLKEVLQKMPSNDQNAKEEMLQKCRLYYRGNKKELEKIDQFDKEYSTKNTIRWYTKDCFVYKLINKALRTEDVESLYTYRFYLIDLCTQLDAIHKTVLEYYQSIKLYRGTKQKQDEIDRLKDSIGHLISTNGYLSTSKNQKVAEMYAGIDNVHSNVNDSYLQSIIFEINYDTSLHPSTIVANITDYSQFEDEQEFLFDLGTVFEIESVSYDDRYNYWICQMSPSSKGADIAKEYLDFKRKEMNSDEADSFVLFGGLLYDMGEYLKCRYYFENLLSDPHEKDTSTLIDIHLGLGRALTGLTQHELGRRHLESALDLCLQVQPPSNNKHGRILAYIGSLYDRQSKFDTALDYYFKGLHMVENDPNNQRLICCILGRIGVTYYNKGQDNLALEYVEKSYEYIENFVPQDHPDRSEYYNNMCMIYYHMGRYNQALFYQKKSYVNHKKLYPTNNHIFLSTDINNIGKCYYKMCQYVEAMKYFKQSLDIARKVLNNEDNYIDMGITINNIGKCFYRQKNYSQALKQYEIVIQLIEKANMMNHIDMAYTLKNIGEVYLDLFNLDLALNYFTQALTIYKNMFSDIEQRDVAKCLDLIGQVHCHKIDDNDLCQNYHEQTLKIWKKVLSSDHPDLALSYKNLALFYLNRKSDYSQAEKYLTMSSHIYEQTLTQDHPHLVKLFEIKRMISKLKRRTILFMIIDSVKLILFFLLFSVILFFHGFIE